MRNNLLLIISIFFTLSLNCQNFVGITKSNDGQTIILNKEDVLEIKLPCQPSTGYGWYPVSIEKSAIKQTGDWEFTSDQINDGIVGQPGTEIIRFIGVSQGTSELTLEYKRLWEKNKSADDVFKIKVTSNGKYSGNYTPPVKVQVFNEKKLPPASSSLPSSFSWLSKCSPVKDQAKCGACWTFAATGAFESIINIIDHNMRNLSEQWLLNCNAKNVNGCLGGACPNSDWVSYGAVYTSDLPYTAGSCTSGACRGTCGTYTHHEKADSSRYINTVTIHSVPDELIKKAIYNYGPVWVDLCSGPNLGAYKGGILTAYDGNQLNHAVVLVGWKDSTLSNGSSGYWIMRNSWGSAYGEHGYVRIGYGVNLIGSDANYIVYKGGIPCSGTPAPGNTLSSANPVCTSETFILSLQNSDQGGSLVYQWQSSADNSTWINITGANQSTYYTTLSAAAYYRCKITCSGNTGISTPLQVKMIAPANCYCLGTYTTCNSPFVDITNVTFGSINNTQPSYCHLPNSYLSFTGSSTTVAAGSSYPIAITAESKNVYWGVWVDWNNSGSFTDDPLKYTKVIQSDPYTFIGSGTIAVPKTATLGNHRMRIRACSETETANPCLSLTWGDQQDYTVNVSVGAGINSLNNSSSLNIYPNPSNGNFTIEMNGMIIGSYTLKIRNLLGEELETENFISTGSENVHSINLSKLSNGIYQISLSNTNTQFNKLILIQK